MAKKHTDGDEALWAAVTAGTTPFTGRARAAAGEEPKPRPSSRSEPAPLAALPKARPSRRPQTTAPPGSLSIDLHGMTLAAAHRAVIRMVARAAEDGQRHIHIVTGKGKNQTGSTIKSELRHWLETPPLKPLILSVRTAPRERGGDGAVDVALRRAVS